MLHTIQYYPTPAALAAFMASHIKNARSILDPSAGDGNLLEAVRDAGEYYTRGEKQLYGVEISPEMCAILHSKGFTSYEGDFLKWESPRQFDAIIMNPPFAHVHDHIFRAWEMLKTGTLVACVPKTALDNFTKREQIFFNLIQDNAGDVYEVGQPFKDADAERKTAVECAVIVLRKADRKSMGFDYTNTPDYTPEDAPAETGLISGDYADALIAVFNQMLGQFEALHQNQQKIYKAMEWFGFDYPEIPLHDALKKESPLEAYNSFLDTLLEKAWAKIYDHPALKNGLTTAARESIEAFRQSRKRVDFTRENIQNLIKTIASQQEKLLRECVIDMFDWFTKYHKDNREHVEGWKSDECWRVNKRIVLPNIIEIDWGGRLSVSWGQMSRLNDVDRAICLVTGAKYDEITPLGSRVDNVLRGGWPSGEQFESKYFLVRAYKKGTIHLVWKDEETRKKFNFAAAAAKNWLPPAQE